MFLFVFQGQNTFIGEKLKTVRGFKHLLLCRIAWPSATSVAQYNKLMLIFILNQ